MDYESYKRSVLNCYSELQSRYVLQNAEIFHASVGVQDLLFADRMLAAWHPKVTTEELTGSGGGAYRKVERRNLPSEKYKVLAGLRQFSEQHVLLIGKPGSGKTTALQKLLVEEVQEGKKLTFLIELRNVNTSVLETVYKFTERHQLELSMDSLYQKLGQGECLLLIDGLNELQSEAMQTEVTKFLKHCRLCSIVASTRDIELGGDFGIQKKLELQPLTPKQVRAFVQIHLTDKEQSEKLLEQVHSRFSDFQETPLLLLMICVLFKREQQIPENLGLIFRKFVQIYDSQFKIGIKNIECCRYFLSYLAFRMMLGKEKLYPLLTIEKSEATSWLAEYAEVSEPHAWAESWIDFLLKYHLLQRRSDGQIEFSHQLLQEYYAAEYLVDYLPQLEEKKVKRNFLNLVKWTEVLKLTQSLIDDCKQALRIARLGLETDLLLGTVLSSEVRDDFEPQSIDQLEKYVSSIRISVRGQHMGQRIRLPTQARYMLQTLLLSRTASKYAVPYLCRFLDSSLKSNLRLQAADALGKLGREEAISSLLSVLKGDDSEEVRLQAAYALGKLGREEAVTALITLLKDISFFRREAVANMLCSLGWESALVSTLDDDDSEVRFQAAYALGKLGREEAVSTLIALLDDSDWYVRNQAVLALRELGREEAVSTLIALLDDDHEFVRRSAAYALGDLGKEEAIIPLTVLLENSEKHMHISAAYALVKLGREENIALLIDLLKDSAWDVRDGAAYALGALGREEAIIPLMNGLEKVDVYSCFPIAEALFKLGQEEAFTPLIELFRLGGAAERSRVAEPLVKIGREEAVAPLMALLENDDDYVYPYTAYVLGKLGSGEAISVLWRLQLKLVCLEAGEDYTQAIESIQNRCQFYSYSLYQKKTLPLLSSPPIPVLFVDDSKHGNAILPSSRVVSSVTAKLSLVRRQNIYAAERDIAEAAREIRVLLQRLKQGSPTDIQTAVREEVRTNPNFYERLHLMLQAGAIEALKAIFPPSGIPVEMIKAWVESAPIKSSQEDSSSNS